MTTLPAGWKPMPASLYELILTGDLESLLWKLKGVHEAEEVRMALYNARQAILATEEYSDCTPPATAQDDPITVSLDPDPRGVSVGVWQGSHCIYNGAHAVPAPAAGDAQELLDALIYLVNAHEHPSAIANNARRGILDHVPPALKRARAAIDAAIAAQQGKGGM